MPEIGGLNKLFRYFAIAFCWAVVFSILTVPLVYAAGLGALALFSCWVLAFLIAKSLKRVPKILDYSYPEFILIWVVTAIVFYPIWLAGLYVYTHVGTWVLGLFR